MRINEQELLTHGDREPKKIALEVFKEVLKSADPYNAVRNALKLEENKLTIMGKSFDIRGDVYVLAFGKAACPMAKAVEETLEDLLKEGLAITKYGYTAPLKKVKVIEAGHPVPDENSLKGTIRGIELMKKVRENDIVIVLISGGGSALFTLPEDGISLNDLIKTHELLVKSGARIHEINVVRKHISKVKGGKLARMVKGTIIAMIISDVVGDNLEVIASGPTVSDPTTFKDAYEILKTYNLWKKLPESVKRHIKLGLKGFVEETVKEDLPNVHNFLIAGNTIACEAAQKKAEELGFKAHILTTTLEGEAKDVGTSLGSIVEEIYKKGRPFKRPCILIAGGETTVTLKENIGKGGPNQELALSIARKIKKLRGVAVLAADTDGTDGPTDAAGGLVDSYTAEILEKKGVNIERVLRKHNAYEALRNANALLFTGPTRTNVNSIVIIVIKDSL
ncbi:MAG: glycerate kinase [Euryarchaeota archaeon]|nr:glycerate kinase [Euryarchaeota archaeon]